MESVNPAKRFRQLTKNINVWTNLLGVDVLAPKVTFNYRTWTTIFAIINYTGFTIFSMVDNGGDWRVSLKASLMFGGLFHGLGKFLTCLLKQRTMRRLTFFACNIYEEYEKKSATNYRTLDLNIDRLLGLMRGIRNGYMATFLLMTVLPLAMLLYDGTRVTVMQYQIPGMPLESNLCYSITYLIHLVTMGVAGCGFYAGDLFVLLGLTQILTFADILQLKVDELNAALDRKTASRALVSVGADIEGEEQRLKLLLDVIKWHQLFTDYCRTVNELYHDLIATQVLSMAVAVMLSFCIILTTFHMPSAIYFLVSAYSMSVYCVLGTKLEFAYDQVYETICGVAWQELSCDQRKLLNPLLREAQNPQCIKLLGILPLSVRTALQIIKLIYSFSMMMMQNRT
ncbi:putative odorant receptor 83c [Drosophila guanche]|uniref:Odorant receptor n=1 Tax=Drosophila guanche TaxID=7266 RepID=A0A3B0K2P5_DROGU|nr:putative odorant receptor 83c [Drosophila guanche]SPP80229.1 blast:Putative odorant receptor 83c [Drosophila guanche]